jgi:glycosyltransferase involved in cell wall biosynthesis
VLFVHDEGGAWTLYRCDHQAEQLAELGMSCDIVRSGSVDLRSAVAHYDTFILNRVAWNDDVAAFVDAAHRAGKRVIFGTDDLIFEPELERCFAFLDNATDADRANWRGRLDAYRRTLAACDAAIVSTEPLAEHARRHVGHVDVVHNAVSGEMVRLADEALEQRPNAGVAADGRDVTIGYLSGTPGHNRDFLEAADAVLWALATYPKARLLVVGPLDLDRRFDTLEGRVTRVPKQRFDSLAALTARIDINLAPLERDNPFTECKSCVKFLEAALVGVPTVASGYPDFARVIESGRNGILADRPSAWTDALGELIESKQRRDEIGVRAFEDVRETHTTRARASEVAAVGRR